jgi:hypothetical protein
MNSKYIESILFAILVSLLVGCSSKVITQEEAKTIADREMVQTSRSDGVDPESMRFIHIRNNESIGAWEIYFENQSGTYRLNILVSHDGRYEIHKLKENRNKPDSINS